jgi:hypothetical protein
MSKWKPEWETKSMDEKIEYALEKLKYHTQRYEAKPTNSRLYKVTKWAGMAAHAVFEVHTDLREEGSLIRYFIGREGRKQGLYGVKLTEFIEAKFQDGTWWKLVPEEVLKATKIA